MYGPRKVTFNETCLCSANSSEDFTNCFSYTQVCSLPLSLPVAPYHFRVIWHWRISWPWNLDQCHSRSFENL